MISVLKVDDDIQLVAPDVEQAVPFFELIEENRKYLNQYITFGQNKDNHAQVAAFLREVSAFNVGGQKFNLLIAYKGSLAGLIGFHRIDRINAKAEIGYWLAEALQGNGIMQKLMPTFLEYAFEGLAINRVDLLTLVTHHRSIALAERSGFFREGTLKEYYFMHNDFQDAVLFRMLKSEFLQKKKDSSKEI